MEEIILPEIKTKTETEDEGTFIIEPLYPGYGQTIGNFLRRVLLSSHQGAAVSSVKIEGISHEFSTLPGVKEDVIEIILNLKSLRLKLFEDGLVKLTLNKKGEGEVKASDIKCPSSCEIVNPDLHIATLDNKKAHLALEIKVDKGRGYVPAEMKQEPTEIGTILVDSFYSPVLRVNYKVENTRVLQRTDYNKLTLEIKTDKTISPKEALIEAAKICVNQFNVFTKIKKEKEKEKVKKKTKKIRPLKQKAKKVKNVKEKKTPKKKKSSKIND